MKYKIYKIFSFLCDLIFEYVFLVCMTFAFALLVTKETFAIDALIFVIVSNAIFKCVEIYRKRKVEKNGKHM